MSEIRIGELQSRVEVTDTEALLAPAVLARIVAAVERELERKDRAEATRRAETRIGANGDRR